MSAAELVLEGGPVFTGEGWARALAVRDGRVVAVAADERAAREWVGPRTRVVSLAGRTALPGFHDAHTHLLGGGLAEAACDASPARSPADLGALVARELAARAASPGAPSARDAWVVGRGWDADLFPGRALPTRAPLDAAAPGVPVLLRRRDGHAALASGRALALAGIDRDTADPPGGRIVRDAGGEPTGLLLEEPAIELVGRHVPPLEVAAQERALARVVRRAAALGITSVQDDPSYADDGLRAAERYAALLARGELPLRVTLWRRLGRPLEELAAEEAALEALGLPPERLRYGLLKGYLDGSLGSRTALLFAPYADDEAGGRGIALDAGGFIPAEVAEAHRAGYQVGLHAIGDRAAALALDAFAGAGPPASVRAARHRIEHAQLFRAEDVARLGALGGVASLQPIHLAEDMRVAPERLGPARCALAFPFAALRAAGAPLAFGTDYPIERLEPLPGVFCALTHRSPRAPELPALAPAQAIPLEAALAAYTAGAAWAARQEGALGRLAPGQLADVAVLDADLTALPPEALPDVRCVLTLLGGEPVHDEGA